MATTFDVIFLGTGPSIDPTEGDSISENAGVLVGQTYGSIGDPLVDHIVSFSPGTAGYGGGNVSGYDTDNNVTNDQFRIDGGADQTVDGNVIYNATITYTDGTTATITATLTQDTLGNLYLLPETSANADQVALEAKPIRALTLDSVNMTPSYSMANRYDANFDTSDGIVDGTDGNDSMGVGYTDGGGDQITENNDVVQAGAGDDTIQGGGGDDTIYGGAGNDVIGDWTGDDGNDLMYGGDGDDIIIGGAGDDTVYGDAGADDLSGGTGSDTLYGGDDADVFSITDDHETDVIYGGEGGDDFDAIAFSNFASSQGVNVTFTGFGQGTYDYGGGWASGTFSEIEAIWSTNNADFIDASLNTGELFVGGYGGDDTIYGGSGDDLLWGGDDDDIITGAGGDDYLDGEAGNDTLTGGDGDDVFVYSPGDGANIITDFNFGNSGTLSDGNSGNNDFINLSGFYDHISELYADQADDGILNQSNDGVDGVDYSDNDQFGAGSLTFTGASADSSSFSEENTGVVCFTSGTAIRTPQGDRLIDDLAVGDLVTTMDNGPQPIRWIGRTCLQRQALLDNPNLRPILIPRGVLGVARSLLVSPQHGMLLGRDHLVRAKHLIDTPKPRVRIAHGRKSVTYIHLMFDTHQIVFAEDAPSESFYPGPMAQRMLDPFALVELRTLFPEVCALQSDKSAIEGSYGDTARLFIKKRFVAEQFRHVGNAMV